MMLATRTVRLAIVLGLLLVAAVVATPALAEDPSGAPAGSPGASPGASPGSSAGGPAFAGVSIVDKAFDPPKIEIHAGDTVTWTVTQSIGEPHSVTAGKPGETGTTPLFDSGVTTLKDNGSKFQYTFTQAGTFDYYCVVHPTTMIGQVVVSGGETGGETGETPVPPERKLIGGAILLVTLVVLFAAARVWRRMNPA